MTDWRRDQPAIAASLALLLAGLCAAAVGPAYVNHDAAWYLYVVQQWHSGATLYRDVVDTNPPLIIWLSAVPVWASWVTGVWPPAVFKWFVFAIAALSLFAVHRTVGREWPHRAFVLVATAAFVCLPFVKSDFGQREHLAVLLTLPYVFAAAAPNGSPRGWRGWCTGAAAGLGFSIKPHFLLAWVAVEAVVAATRGTRALRRPEPVAVIAIVLAYTAAIAAFTPDYLTVADDVRHVYGGLNSPASVLLRLREVQLWLVAAAIFAAVRWPDRAGLNGILFAAGTGYLAAALLQFKGWGYQLYPARALLVLFLMAGAATVLDALPGAAALLRGGRRGLAVVFAGILVVASVRYLAEARSPVTPDLVAPFMTAIDGRTPGQPFAVLSMRTIIYPAFPAVNYTRARWGLRHNSLWFLPGFYDMQDRQAGGPLQPHALDEMPPLERKFFDQIVDDLCAAPPALLAIERAPASSPAGRRALDLEAYYGQSRRAQQLLRAYRVEGSIGSFSMMAPATTPSCE